MTAKLSKDERVFLAGAMKSMLLAEDRLSEEGLAELDALIKKLGFTDYEECLSAFEESTKDDEAFWERARSVRRPEARTVILSALRALMLHEGIPEPPEVHLLSRLDAAWRG